MNSSFEERFDIHIGSEEAQKGFIHQIYNELFEVVGPGTFGFNGPQDVDRLAATAVREHYRPGKRYYEYIDDDFLNCLRAIEKFWARVEDLAGRNSLADHRDRVNQIIITALHETGTSLSVTWENGYFLPQGAENLDRGLVNEPLRWLRRAGLDNIYKPFEKALLHYRESSEQPEKLRDVVTDMYEALEATAQIVNDNDKDLSANAQKFIANLRLSNQHSEMLRAYIDYANKFARHARNAKAKKDIGNAETENFIYLTGIFIRFAIQKLEEGS